MAQMEAEQRQADISKRGSTVMQFNLAATTHLFTKNEQGGVQRVVAKKPSDTRQIALIRRHLRKLRTQFLAGDFSAPIHIHGKEMPGLAELKSAPRGQVRIDYRSIQMGAELSYTSAEPRLVAALHRWFDVQLSDHGHDVVQGNAMPDGAMKY